MSRSQERLTGNLVINLIFVAIMLAIPTMLWLLNL